MMDLATIRALSRKAAQESRAQGVIPVTISLTALNRVESLHELGAQGTKVPFIGDRTPKGFRKVGEALFVDTSGFGRDDEPALSDRQALLKLREMTEAHGTLAWALVEVGQFQGYLQAYKVTGR